MKKPTKFQFWLYLCFAVAWLGIAGLYTYQQRWLLATIWGVGVIIWINTAFVSLRTYRIRLENYRLRLQMMARLTDAGQRRAVR